MYSIVGACIAGVPENVEVLNHKALPAPIKDKKIVACVKSNYTYEQTRKILFNHAKVDKKKTRLLLSDRFSLINKLDDDQLDSLALGLAYIKHVLELDWQEVYIYANCLG